LCTFLGEGEGHRSGASQEDINSRALSLLEEYTELVQLKNELPSLPQKKRVTATDDYLVALERDLSGLVHEVKTLERRQEELSKKVGLILLMFEERTRDEGEGGDQEKKVGEIFRFLIEIDRLLLTLPSN
jgi:hypothetical protein